MLKYKLVRIYSPILESHMIYCINLKGLFLKNSPYHLKTIPLYLLLIKVIESLCISMKCKKEACQIYVEHEDIFNHLQIK